MKLLMLAKTQSKSFTVLWSGLVSWVGALHRVNLIAPFPFGQNGPRKIPMNASLVGNFYDQVDSTDIRYLDFVSSCLRAINDTHLTSHEIYWFVHP